MPHESNIVELIHLVRIYLSLDFHKFDRYPDVVKDLLLKINE